MAGIKRHEALQELSRHHHHALVVAMSLNRAKSENISRVRQEVIEFWDQGGNEHFREEEDILLPTYAKYKDLKRDENVIRMLIEHVQIRMLVQTIRDTGAEAMESANRADQESANGADWAAALDAFHELGRLLKGHVQLEEQIIFTEIQDTVPEPDLFAIQHFFHEM